MPWASRLDRELAFPNTMQKRMENPTTFMQFMEIAVAMF